MSTTDLSQAAPAQTREIAVITMEIRTLHQQAQQLILGYAIEIGRRLAEAKAQLPHGGWGPWLKNEVEFSRSTANNFMRIFEAYGAPQLGLFGPEANSQTLGNLPYTKALQLLAVPEEEREEFAEENDVEHLSSRQLEQLIRQRDEAQKLREEAQERAQDLETRMKDMEGQLEEATQTSQDQVEQRTEFLRQELEQAQAAAAAGAKEQVAAAQQLQALTEKLDKAKKDAAQAKDKLKQLQDAPPVVAPEVLEEMREQAAKEAQEAAAQVLEQQLADAAARTAQAEKDAQDAKAAMEAARKQLELAAPEVAQFQVYFAAWQQQFNSLLELLGSVDGAVSEKLRAAAGSVLEQMAQRLEEKP